MIIICSRPIDSLARCPRLSSDIHMVQEHCESMFPLPRDRDLILMSSAKNLWRRLSVQTERDVAERAWHTRVKQKYTTFSAVRSVKDMKPQDLHRRIQPYPGLAESVRLQHTLLSCQVGDGRYSRQRIRLAAIGQAAARRAADWATTQCGWTRMHAESIGRAAAATIASPVLC